MDAKPKSVAVLAALCVLAFSLTSLSGSAFHNPGIPLVESIPIESSSYAAVRVNVPAGGGDFSVEIQGDRGAEATMSSLGVWSLNADGSPRFAFVFSAFATGSEDLLHVGVPPAGTVLHEQRGGAGGFTGVATTSRDLPAGEHLFLAVGAADSETLDGEINFYASSGVSYTYTTGDAFLFREPDFNGANVVYKSPQGPTGGTLWAKAISGATAEVEVDGNLYGLFQGFSNGNPNGQGRLHMSLDGPGVDWSGSCAGGGFCAALTFVHQGAPGDYTFSIDENIETWDGNGFPPVLWAMGADVQLP